MNFNEMTLMEHLEYRINRGNNFYNNSFMPFYFLEDFFKEQKFLEKEYFYYTNFYYYPMTTEYNKEKTKSLIEVKIYYMKSHIVENAFIFFFEYNNKIYMYHKSFPHRKFAGWTFRTFFNSKFFKEYVQEDVFQLIKIKHLPFCSDEMFIYKIKDKENFCIQLENYSFRYRLHYKTKYTSIDYFGDEGNAKILEVSGLNSPNKHNKNSYLWFIGIPIEKMKDTLSQKDIVSFTGSIQIYDSKLKFKHELFNNEPPFHYMKTTYLNNDLSVLKFRKYDFESRKVTYKYQNEIIEYLAESYEIDCPIKHFKNGKNPKERELLELNMQEEEEFSLP